MTPSEVSNNLNLKETLVPELDFFETYTSKKSRSNREYTANFYNQEEFDKLNSLYENYYKQNFSAENPLRSKELENRESLRVVIRSVNGDIAIGESSIGQSIVIDVAKEEKAIYRLGFPPINMEIGSVLDVVILKDAYGNYNGSVSQGYENTLKNELTKAIKEENTAYLVKVEDLCPGGFMVNLSGIKCFLPGSLAAANRIIDFASFVGKEIRVMVETYDEKRDIFVVSFKKYLKNVINSKVNELSITQKYTGTVTGTSSAGVFVEWDEYYTGLIPAEEFPGFDSKVPYRSGDKAEFFVSDMRNPQRIVLTVKVPDAKTTELESMRTVCKSREDVYNKGGQFDEPIYTGKITRIKNFGVFVKLDSGLNGLVEREELDQTLDNYKVDDTIECYILDVEIATGKLHLREKYQD